MAFCTRCGTRLPEDARFCPACGAAVSDADTPMAEAAPWSDPYSPSSPDAVPLPERRGSSWRWLAGLMAIALVVVAIVVVQQRDGARAIANESAPSDTPSPTPRASETPADDIPEPEPSDLPTDAPTPAVVTAATVIPASAIAAAFAEDPDSAAAAFSSAVRVRGIVSALGEDNGRAAATLQAGPAGDVVVHFADDQRDAAALLEPGSVVRLSCAGAREGDGAVLLEECRL